MRIISANTNGIRAAAKKGFFDWLQKVDADVICIQETKAQFHQLDENPFCPINYFCEYHDAVKKGYSGVAVITNKKPNIIKNGFGIEKFDSEGRLLELDFGGFTLFNIYFPNGRLSPERLQYKMDFYDAFLKHADGLRKQGKKLIICGDVNTAHKEIDLAHPKSNEKRSGFLPEERAWIDKLVSHGYVDTFRIDHL